MKKVSTALLILTLLNTVGCIEDDGNEGPPVGSGSIEVTVNHDTTTDLATLEAGKEGTGLYYIYLYDEKFGDYSNNPDFMYEGSKDTVDSPILLTGVVPGDYYVAAFYDHSGKSENNENRLSRYDPYILYNNITGTPFVDDTEITTIEIHDEETTDIILNISNDDTLGKSGNGNGRLFKKTTD